MEYEDIEEQANHLSSKLRALADNIEPPTTAKELRLMADQVEKMPKMAWNLIEQITRSNAEAMSSWFKAR